MSYHGAQQGAPAPSATGRLARYWARDRVWSFRLQVGVLRELIRNLQQWEALFADEHIDTITGPDGSVYHLSDIQYLFECRTLLSPRQRQAIELCLYQDTKEKDATLIMGVSRTNPVAMYATNGLRRICEMIEAGQLDRYHPEQRLTEAVVA